MPVGMVLTLLRNGVQPVTGKLKPPNGELLLKRPVPKNKTLSCIVTMWQLLPIQCVVWARMLSCGDKNKSARQLGTACSSKVVKRPKLLTQCIKSGLETGLKIVVLPSIHYELMENRPSTMFI